LVPSIFIDVPFCISELGCPIANISNGRAPNLSVDETPRDCLADCAKKLD